MLFIIFCYGDQVARTNSTQNQSIVAQRAETTVTTVFPDKLHMSSFPDRFLHYTWTTVKSAYSDFIGLRVRDCYGVTCHLHFWQHDQGLLCATAVT